MSKKELLEQKMFEIGKKYIPDLEKCSLLLLEVQSKGTIGYVYINDKEGPKEVDIPWITDEEHYKIDKIATDFVETELEECLIEDNYKEEIREYYIFRLNIRTGKLFETSKEEEIDCNYDQPINW